MNSSTISAAGEGHAVQLEVTGLCTWPLVTGTWAMMVFLMLACQMRTTRRPRHARRINQAGVDGEGASRRGQVAAAALTNQ